MTVSYSAHRIAQWGLSLLCDLLFMMYVKYQSIAYIFMLTFDKFCDCVGIHPTFVKKKFKKSLDVWKKGLTFAAVILKTIFLP